MSETMKEIPVFELVNKCLSIRFFKGKVGLDVHWGECGTGIDFFVFKIGELNISLTDYRE